MSPFLKQMHRAVTHIHFKEMLTSVSGDGLERLPLQNKLKTMNVRCFLLIEERLGL